MPCRSNLLVLQVAHVVVQTQGFSYSALSDIGSPLAEMVVSCGFTWREGLVIIILDGWFASNIMYYRNQDNTYSYHIIMYYSNH